MNVNKLVNRIYPKKLRHPWPVRVMHWTMAPSFLLLAYTGIYIAHPGVVPFPSMRQARRYHFLGQFIFTGSVISRFIYGRVTGNYREIVPGKKDLAAVPGFLSYLFFLKKKEPSFPKYNPVQKIYFTAWFPLFMLQALTGAVMYAPRRLGAVEAAFGGLNRVRRLHYLNTLGLTSSVIGHLYLALTSGVEKLKSIFTGYKAVGKK